MKWLVHGAYGYPPRSQQVDEYFAVVILRQQLDGNNVGGALDGMKLMGYGLFQAPKEKKHCVSHLKRQTPLHKPDDKSQKAEMQQILT